MKESEIITELAALIDHTELRPDASRERIESLCREARALGFAAVCVNPFWTRLAADSLAGTRVGVCTVVAFPLGAPPTAVKVFETGRALDAGATEIDVVMNVG